MADDRMKNDDLDRNMGRGRDEGQDFGRETPGRNPQGDRSTGAGQQSGQQKEPRNFEEEDEFDGGAAGKTGGQNRGGQNR